MTPMVNFEIQQSLKHKLKFLVEEGSHASWDHARSTSNSMNIHNNSKQTTTNNALPIEMNLVFGINTNSCSADRKEGTDLDTLSDFTKQK